MRVLLVSLLAVALWSIDSLGAVRTASQGDITPKINPSRAQVNLGEYLDPGMGFNEGLVVRRE